MKISTKGHYGIRFLLDLASQKDEGFVSINEIAKRQELSEKYLWQIIAPLKSRGLLQVARGVTGGYKLARPPETISVRELVEALEGRIIFRERDKNSEQTEKPVHRVANELWSSLEKVVAASMQEISLRHLLDKQKALETAPADYVI